MTAGGATLRCVELTPEMWPAVEELFGPRGACGGCWCMWWRVERGGALWDRTRGAPAKRAFKRLVRSGAARGVLAFAGDEPVGWCAFGPRADFPRLATVRAFRGVPTAEGVWSINCFFVRRGWRRRGVAGRLLEAAVAACRRAGASEVEGYPIESRDRDIADAFGWTGPRRIFDASGFREVPTPPAAKRLVRLRLERAGRSATARPSRRSGTR